MTAGKELLLVPYFHVVFTLPNRTQHTETGLVGWAVRFELRNVVAKYPFERSHSFPVIDPIAAADLIAAETGCVIRT
jgi:hypothetical protein